ncbi:hypothetical protein D9M73_271720 [compost metagenome]
MSCSTSTWPEQSAPAPMPMVGTVSDCVISPASAAGTASISTTCAPAACSASASRLSWAAPALVLPCTLKPPSACTDCGVRPICAQTGMLRSTRNLTIGASQSPPSSLTICAPAFISVTALANAASGVG